MKGWTQKDIDRLKNKKQVKTKRSSPKSKQPKGRMVTKYFPQKSKEKDFIEYHLVEFYKNKGIKLYEEYRFHEVRRWRDRKSTRLNSSHVSISYAVFCLKKKIQNLCDVMTVR